MSTFRPRKITTKLNKKKETKLLTFNYRQEKKTIKVLFISV